MIAIIKRNILILIIIATYSSCGIYSFTGASIPPEAKTVSVGFFQNMATIVQPTVSPVFTEKLQDRLSSQTSLQLVTEEGDLQFSGEITSYINRPAAIVAGETAAKQRLSITIHVIFKNYYDEKSNFDTNFTRYAEFDSDVNLFSVESELIDQILDEITEDIFNKAVVNW